ncbi:MAG TPA: lysophospholipid acyltransferase family protein [Blastocatellia bacterium]
MGFARVLTGARALWQGCAPVPTQRIYYGNHTSHGDFVLIWAALPARLRRRTRPVAGADYWERSRLRRWLIHRAFRGVVIERVAREGGTDPVTQMCDALARGHSLILFPEGTRGSGDGIGPFRSGIAHLVAKLPEVPVVPAYLANMGRSLPKGEIIPVPFFCEIRLGAPLKCSGARQQIVHSLEEAVRALKEA